MVRLASPDEVLECIAARCPDSNNIWPGEWLQTFARYDVCSELINEICKHRKEPAFAELVSILEASIEAHQSDRENGLI